MELDLELYRHEVTVSTQPRVQLSVLDVAPAAAQKTLVLLHGFGGEARQWRYQIQHFAESQRVIAFDLRGHGHADKPVGPYHMEQILGDLEAAIAQLKIDGRVILVGHSFGGALATMVALAHPDQIEHLVLIATPGRFELNRVSRFIFRLPQVLLRPLERFARAWLHAPLYVLQPWHQNTLAPWDGWRYFPQLTVP
ncbi:MAG TPA: alpha/beta fold hydrolase, partial [Caldilineaceae bacterium]|nr:alpha/beta fold hydrolase [Caldilineaceae bacterium]